MGLDHLPDVFTRAEAVAAGLSDAKLATMVRHGTVLKVRHGVLTKSSCAPLATLGAPHGPSPTTPTPSYLLKRSAYIRNIEACVKAFAAGFAVSHLSAAALHGLDLPLGELGAPHLTAIQAVQRSKRPDGVVLHHADSSETPCTTVDGLSVTTVARTVADCLRLFPDLVAVPLADSAIRAHGITVEDIESELGRQRRWAGRPRALASLAIVDGRRETWIESYSFVHLHRLGHELPTPQVELFDAEGDFVGRVDGIWLDDGVVAEVDGRAKYEPEPGETPEQAIRRVLYAEKVREDGIRRLGLGVVRWGLSDLIEHRDALDRRIRQERQAGRGPGFRGTYRVPTPTGRSKSAI